MLWWKWLYWKKGISTRDFRNEYVKDIRDVIELDSVIHEKEHREAKLRSMISKVR